ncbi:DUF3387 domain-containing protein [Sphingobacterium daejeonense]|uniref:DUF3387 domain-containing protein n=1 Tax=Sphingobacterium daejeonense TaxID=371142 RepID=UPI0021A7A972|nr:DUF3387 domain-containing protein [Sphingobacterium daejeonense]MCT1531524.1 DUF3387 domain-containing protein [Sphingobacterium daejeonense]
MNELLKSIIQQILKSMLKLVDKLLRKYGYPPSMQTLATEAIVKQAELLCKELSR